MQKSYHNKIHTPPPVKKSASHDFLTSPPRRAGDSRNLYMIIKEALNNSIKYAHANELRLIMYVDQGKLRITIKDNGKGFEQCKGCDANGLKNMKLRAEQINYY